MNNYTGPFPNFPYQLSGFPRLSENPIHDSEIPAIQDKVEIVAQQSMQQLSGSNDNKFVDVTKLRFGGELFTREESIALVRAKMDYKRVDEIVQMFQGKTAQQIHTYWQYIKNLNPGLDEKVKLARAEPDAPVEQLNLSVQAAVRNLRFPNGKLFTREESIALVYAKIADKRLTKIAEMFPGRSNEQIASHWVNLKLNNPDLNQIVILVREDPAVDLTLELNQPKNRIQKNEISPSTERRLVFSVPLPLGEVIVKWPTGLKFTVEEDIEIINAIIAQKSTRVIAEGMPGQTEPKIKGRLLYLRKTIPNLDNIILAAKSAQARLERIEPAFLMTNPDIESKFTEVKRELEARIEQEARINLETRIELEAMREAKRELEARIEQEARINLETRIELEVIREAKRKLEAWIKLETMLGNLPPLPYPLVQNPVQQVEPAAIPIEQVQRSVQFVPQDPAPINQSGVDNPDLSGFLVLPDNFLRDFEQLQDGVEVVAQQAIQQLSESNDNNFVDVTKLRFGGEKTFTQEESIALVNAKVAGKPIVYAEMFPGRTPKMVHDKWYRLKKLNPNLEENVKRAREQRAAHLALELDQKRNTDVLDGSIQPAKRIRKSKKSALEEFRLVFSVPFSLGEVFIKRNTELGSTIEEDIEIINGVIAEGNIERVRHLMRTNPDLQNIIQAARSANARLERMEAALLPEQETGIEIEPNPLVQNPVLQVDPAAVFIPFEFEESSVLYDQNPFR